MIRYYCQPKIHNSPYPPYHINPAGALANLQECLQAQQDCYLSVTSINIPLLGIRFLKGDP